MMFPLSKSTTVNAPTKQLYNERLVLLIEYFCENNVAIIPDKRSSLTTLPA